MEIARDLCLTLYKKGICDIINSKYRREKGDKPLWKKILKILFY